MVVEDQESTPAGLIKLVGRRYNVLASLDTAPADKRTLENELDISRSTVDRAVRELEAGCLVNWSNDGYQTTLYGRSLLAVYESILNHAEYVRHAKPLLAVLPPTVDFDLSVLINSTIYLAKESAPQAPIVHITERIEDSIGLKALHHSYFSSKLLDTIYSRAVQNDLSAKLVFRESMFSHLKDEQPTEIRELERTDNTSIYTIEEVPYGLFLLTTETSQEVCLVVYGHSQQFKGVLINDNPDAVSWARQVFEEYRNEAFEL